MSEQLLNLWLKTLPLHGSSLKSGRNFTLCNMCTFEQTVQSPDVKLPAS